MPNELIGYGEELTSQILDRRLAIQRALSEYRDLLRAESARRQPLSRAAKARIQRRLQRSVSEYVQLCRAFERVQTSAE
jgi:hypothetical protein